MARQARDRVTTVEPLNERRRDEFEQDLRAYMAVDTVRSR
jgi:hypothetical protein